ncbi:MAG: ATP-binding protein [Polaromonas sp.]|uniref:ATP-binding protein n=1 Tax=Polaromonas sp. TaxID=1869339 RepID=UPI002733301A|nr:ATP-binding protein [Polaromonas sp.]MDP2818568.1 ATP-binding protein [Polaromonas sp.]
MDGFQIRIRQSLQLRLSASLSIAIMVVAISAGIFSFVSAYEEAIELQDEQLRQMAAMIARQDAPLRFAKSPKQVPDRDAEFRVAVQLLTQSAAAGPLLTGELPGLASDLPEGIQTVETQGVSWRLFVQTLDADSRIAVGQKIAVRDEVARDGALRTLMPFFVLFPVLLLLVADLIRKMFQPLKTLADDLDMRSEDDLREITATGLPSEIRPFVVAINRLLSRIAQSSLVQRRFVADAAHELRSPLTALSLQAERMAAAEMSLEAASRLATLRQGIHRNRNLLDQLLTLARAQHLPLPLEASEAVSIQLVFRQVLEDLMPLAESKGIDLGVTGEMDATVGASEVDLYALVKNLVDNAIRYTPQSGRIDLSAEASDGTVTLTIADTGPGIPEEERERVFDPFYRVLGNSETGSGLGLSIVKAIASRIGAIVHMSYSDEKKKTGLRVRVVLLATVLRPLPVFG